MIKTVGVCVCVCIFSLPLSLSLSLFSNNNKYDDHIIFFFAFLSNVSFNHRSSNKHTQRSLSYFQKKMEWKKKNLIWLIDLVIERFVCLFVILISILLFLDEESIIWFGQFFFGGAKKSSLTVMISTKKKFVFFW